MDSQDLRHIILEITEESLAAQLRAVRRLQDQSPSEPRPEKSMSQLDMVYNILNKSGKALHVTEILSRVESVYGIQLDRESIVSALTKKVHRQDRFVRSGKNTFSIRKEGEK